jgi:hypothetical protein
MNFYTSVNRYGNNILYRGFENGKRISQKIPYGPTLFIPTTKETGWYNLKNLPVQPVHFDTMREAGDFIKKYDGVDNFPVYGMTNYVTQFIEGRFAVSPEVRKDKVNITSLDIEVHSEDGFPFVEDAEHPVVAITMKSNLSDTYYIWGLKDYDEGMCKVSKRSTISSAKMKSRCCFLGWVIGKTLGTVPTLLLVGTLVCLTFPIS